MLYNIIKKYSVSLYKNTEKQVKVIRHGNCRFTIISSSYSVNSDYFNTIFNLLRSLKIIRLIFIEATIQISSTVIEKRGGRGTPDTSARVLLCELKKLLLYESCKTSVNRQPGFRSSDS